MTDSKNHQDEPQLSEEEERELFRLLESLNVSPSREVRARILEHARTSAEAHRRRAVARGEQPFVSPEKRLRWRDMMRALSEFLSSPPRFRRVAVAAALLAAVGLVVVLPLQEEPDSRIRGASGSATSDQELRFHEAVLEVTEGNLGTDHPLSLEVAKRLVELYGETGQPARSKEVQDRYPGLADARPLPPPVLMQRLNELAERGAIPEAEVTALRKLFNETF